MVEMPIWVVVVFLSLAVLVAFIAIVVAVCCRGEADEWRRKFIHIESWITQNNNDPYCVDLKTILVCEGKDGKVIYSNQDIPFIKSTLAPDWMTEGVYWKFQYTKKQAPGFTPDEEIERQLKSPWAGLGIRSKKEESHNGK